MTTPRELGYRMPAEWEPHAATWLSWPHNEASWPGKFEVIPPVYAQMVAALARSEPVHINVNDAEMERQARKYLKQAGAAGEIHFHHFPTNDAWCRDHGAIFIVRGDENTSPLPPREGPEVRAADEAAAPTPTAPPPHPPFGHLLPQGGEGKHGDVSRGDSRCEGESVIHDSTTSPLPPGEGPGVRAAGQQIHPTPTAPPPHPPSGQQGNVAAVNWGYNAWGGKYPHDLDNQIPPQMAAEWGVSVFDNAMVLEGGSIDVNGSGLLMTTTSCLLNPNRNPRLTRAQIEEQLAAFLGVDEFLWLGDGIEGDDTDGHIDDLARFVAEDVVVTTVEPNTEDVNHRPLRENLQTLQNLRTRAGRSLGIVELPMPPAVVWDGQRLPATYANFYIANRVVLLPGYHKTTDETARRILQDLFPTREVVVIDCTDLIWGLGAFHCLTQQVPAM